MDIKIQHLDMAQLDSKIEHLDKEAIVEMIKQYYDGISVTQLKDIYNINVPSSRFVKLFPKIATNKKCEYCDLYLVMDWKAKHSYQSGEKEPYCSFCGHEKHEECTCNNCELFRNRIRVQEIKRKRNLIHRNYSEENYTKVLESKLSLEDKLYLSVLIRGGLNEDLGYIMPINTLDRKLTPTSDYTMKLIKTLTGRGLIKPHKDSSVKAFVDDEGFPDVYYIKDVIYHINIAPKDTYQKMITHLMYPSQKEFEVDKEYCLKAWRRIALNESIEYLLYSLDKVGFDFNPGEKTRKVFERLLDHYSVSQIYSIIYRSVANSTKIYQENRISKKRAANTVITLCQSFGERAIAEGWNLSKYNRDFNLPETIISQVFFTSILKIARLGFDEPPTSQI